MDISSRYIKKRDKLVNGGISKDDTTLLLLVWFHSTTLCFLQVIGCMVCACLHRRHLMVWQIFAPRFIFEGVSLLVILFTSIISFTLVKHTGKRIGIWLNDVECSLE